MKDSAEKYAGIIKRQTADYNLFIKDDGTDYVKIWSAFKEGLVQELVCLNTREDSQVFKFKFLERYFIMKVDKGYPRHLDSKIRRILKGPAYSMQMKAINKAVNAGAKYVTDFYLVAEKRSGLISRESNVLMEYLDGHILAKEKDFTIFHADITNVINELHQHNMALCDVNPHNFIITKHGMKTIDLSWRGLAWAGKGKDLVFIKQMYGIELPANMSMKLAVLYVRSMLKIRHTLRWLRKSITGKDSSKKKGS